VAIKRKVTASLSSIYGDITIHIPITELSMRDRIILHRELTHNLGISAKLGEGALGIIDYQYDKLWDTEKND